jgi:SAM-dependent methyltransferase
MSLFKRDSGPRSYQLPEAPIAGRIRVAERIGHKDGMFKKGFEEHYFSVGRSALEAVRLAMLAAKRADFSRILDLPCGHGRVLRALKGAFPRAQLTACDLNRAGVDFCVENFGASGDYSDAEPAKIALKGPYDLIWSGSLLTHLSEGPYVEFLGLFARLLEPGGVFVATTHGRHVAARLRAGTHTYKLAPEALPGVVAQYDATGFGYADYPAGSGYGISVNSPEWLLRKLSEVPGLRVAMFSENLWDGHQDVVACVKG